MNVCACGEVAITANDIDADAWLLVTTDTPYGSTHSMRSCADRAVNHLVPPYETEDDQ